MKTALPLFHLVEGQVVLVLGEGESAKAKARLAQRPGARVLNDPESAAARGARIAFVALEEASDDQLRETVKDLRARGFLVNVADRPELCDFFTPSILRRDPVLIAIGTGGASAGLAKHLRLRLEQLLPDSLGQLAQTLFEARAKLREDFPDAAQRRQWLDRALLPGGAFDPLDPASAQRARAWFEGDAPLHANGVEGDGVGVYTIALTSADPDDLTIRQARWLGLADTIVLDGAVPEAILDRARADAARLPIEAFDDQPEAATTPDRLVVVLRAPPPRGHEASASESPNSAK